jgi:dihydroflavonol-4-reductase
VPKTLLTGGTGFIGSHVAHLLAERGDDLRVTIRERSKLEALKPIDGAYEPATCDLLDRRQVRRALKGVDRVFHCAGSTSLRQEDARRVFDLNVGATRLLLEEALRSGVERVVHTSSAMAIGMAEPGRTADENTLFTAGRLGIPFVNSKHEAEVEALRLAAQGLPLVCVNPCFVLGAGDVYVSSTSVVRRFLLGHIPAYTDGGINVVDVNDVARGHLLADEKGGVGERYILGNRNYTWTRLFADLSRVSGVEPPALRLSAGPAVALARAAEVAPGRPPVTIDEVKAAAQWWTYRSTKAKRDLGWTTTPHEDTVDATVGWYVDREGDRFRRSRRSQPVQYRVAAAGLGILGRLTGRAG